MTNVHRATTSSNLAQRRDATLGSSPPTNRSMTNFLRVVNALRKIHVSAMLHLQAKWKTLQRHESLRAITHVQCGLNGSMATIILAIQWKHQFSCDTCVLLLVHEQWLRPLQQKHGLSASWDCLVPSLASCFTTHVVHSHFLVPPICAAIPPPMWQPQWKQQSLVQSTEQQSRRTHSVATHI